MQARQDILNQGIKAVAVLVAGNHDSAALTRQFPNAIALIQPSLPLPTLVLPDEQLPTRTKIKSAKALQRLQWVIAPLTNP